MGRASVSVVGFALSDGSAADTAGVASVAPVPDRFGRVLLACVEPIELSSRGMELAAVALAGREIFVAQASPSQAILVQDGQVYAFPDVASWRGDYAPDTSVSESHPLGFGDEPTPRLYHSEAAPGDLIV